MNFRKFETDPADYVKAMKHSASITFAILDRSTNLMNIC